MWRFALRQKIELSGEMRRHLKAFACASVIALLGAISTQALGGGNEWPTYANLRSVAFAADGLHGWAVGDSGIIVATADGGRHWTRQTSPTSENLQSVAIAADSLHGWAVGDGGTIIATADGGGHWTRQTSPASASEFLSSVAFAADGLDGWAVSVGSGPGSLGGIIIATADGGRHWTRQTSPTPEAGLLSVAIAADGLHGVNVGSSRKSTLRVCLRSGMGFRYRSR